MPRPFKPPTLPTFVLLALLTSWVHGEPAVNDSMVEMRDKTSLATTVYLPSGGGPWPCVLARTPYNKRGLHSMAREFVKADYAFVAQDCRGRFGSKGEYVPFRTDHHDGYDTVEWVARQKWSNGKVGMVGMSALGITAHLAATQVPPHLVCAYVVVAGASARRQTVYMGGVYRKELNDGWLTMQGASRIIREQVKRPPGDAYWDWREIRDFHSRIKIPIFEVGGWWDIFQQGTIDNHVGLQANGAGRAAGNQRLVMGPWAHGKLNGRLRFPDDRVGEFISATHSRRWFDRWLKNNKNGVDHEPPVLYYVLGDPDDKQSGGCQWRTTTSWPPAARPASFYLHPERGLSRNLPPSAKSWTTYKYDPKNPVPTAGGNNLILGGKGPVDQRNIGERNDYLRFVSAPLKKPVEIAGQVFVDLYVSSDAPDTDFVAKLVDVYPDGYEALILDGILRCRYREGLSKEVFLKSGEVVPLRIDLWSTAIVFSPGHRIAVHITSSNDPRFDPNPNTGKPLRSGTETRIATNTVHHSSKYPSRVLLPVVE